MKILHGTQPPCCPVCNDFYGLEAREQKHLVDCVSAIGLGHIPQQLSDVVVR